MNAEAIALNPTRLVIAAILGLVILLFLIIKCKVQAMIAILVGAISIGLFAGMPAQDIITAVNDGIGNTLKGIALLVGLGSMFGAILEVSGGAQTLAVSMVRWFGDKKAAWALGITGLVIAMPVFFDAGLIILIPLVLIILDSITGVVPALSFLQPIFGFLGEPFVALLIATIAAMLVLGVKHGYSMEELEKIMTKSLEPTGLILLVTACGGVLRYVLQYSGLGDLIGNAVAAASLPLVVLAFLVAALVRICVGSATVAMTMAAGIVSAIPGISELSPLYLACVTAAVAGGATVCSHFNDSGFWLVKSLVGMDEKTTLKTWTIMETLVGTTGFLVALVISFFA
ncbi:MAG: GntP family permease [Fusicatenibacter sp.]|nr:GntP family permease [Fusicatenibacter sp.]